MPGPTSSFSVIRTMSRAVRDHADDGASQTVPMLDHIFSNRKSSQDFNELQLRCSVRVSLNTIDGSVNGLAQMLHIKSPVCDAGDSPFGPLISEAVHASLTTPSSPSRSGKADCRGRPVPDACCQFCACFCNSQRYLI